MNELVELKFMRSIVVHYFGHPKVIELDDIYFGDKKAIDEDCKSIMNIINMIKENKLSVSVDSLHYIYENLFPTLDKKNVERKLVESLCYNIRKCQSYYEIIKKNISDDTFYEFSFCMLSFCINIIHYNRFKTFYVIPLAMDISLKTNFLEDMDAFRRQLGKIEELNQNYHIQRTVFSYEDIENIISAIPKEDLDFFGIREINLYGSYAKNRVNDYSDLDFHIKVDKIKDCLTEQGDFISSYLSHIFKTKVDAKVSYIHDVLDENIKALFNKEIKIPLKNFKESL